MAPFSNTPTNGLNGEPDHAVVPDLLQRWRVFPAAEASVDGADVEPTVAPFGVLVSVVIPTLNEEKNLPYVLSGLPRGLHEVIASTATRRTTPSRLRSSCGRTPA